MIFFGFFLLPDYPKTKVWIRYLSMEFWPVAQGGDVLRNYLIDLIGEFCYLVVVIVLPLHEQADNLTRTSGRLMKWIFQKDPIKRPQGSMFPVGPF